MSLKPDIRQQWEKLKGSKRAYSIHVADVYDVFLPSAMHLGYKSAPEKHKSILVTLKMIDRAKGFEYDIQHPNLTKRFLMDPDLTKPVKYQDEPLKASPSIMYTEFAMTRDSDDHAERTFFGATITDYLLPEKHDGHCRTKFAIGGFFDKRHQYTVERIMIPHSFENPGSGVKWLTMTDIHEASIRGALHYARLCVEQMFEGKEFTPEANFKRSMGQLPNEAQIKVNERLEPKRTFGLK